MVFADEGVNAISSINDPWGKPLHYRLINRVSFEMSSEGPDNIFMTQYDVRAIVTVESKTIQQQQEMATNNADDDAPAMDVDDLCPAMDESLRALQSAADAFFDPAEDKVYRHASFYKLPPEVDQM